MMFRDVRISAVGGIIGLLVIVIAIYFIIKYLNRNNNGFSIFKKKVSEIDRLNERYSKGEIDEEEYNKIRNTLDN